MVIESENDIMESHSPTTHRFSLKLLYGNFSQQNDRKFLTEEQNAAMKMKIFRKIIHKMTWETTFQPPTVLALVI